MRTPLLALALGAALLVTGCGEDAAAPTAAAPHSGHSSSASAADPDVAFLSGMAPHHEQAVVMSDLVLAADPPAAVAALARDIKAAQAPEVAEMEQMLADLGTSRSEHAGHGADHPGMLSDADLAALDAATGEQAARLFLEGMIAHHEGAVTAAQAQLTEGRYPPARSLADRVVAQQTAEIARMRELLAAL